MRSTRKPWHRSKWLRGSLLLWQEILGNVARVMVVFVRGMEDLWSLWIGIMAPYPCTTPLARTLARILALARALALALALPVPSSTTLHRHRVTS